MGVSSDTVLGAQSDDDVAEAKLHLKLLTPALTPYVNHINLLCMFRRILGAAMISEF